MLCTIPLFICHTTYIYTYIYPHPNPLKWSWKFGVCSVWLSLTNIQGKDHKLILWQYKLAGIFSHQVDRDKLAWTRWDFIIPLTQVHLAVVTWFGYILQSMDTRYELRRYELETRRWYTVPRFDYDGKIQCWELARVMSDHCRTHQSLHFSIPISGVN